jgi:hypothetical protein
MSAPERDDPKAAVAAPAVETVRSSEAGVGAVVVPPHLSFRERLSDRLNPILVRETQQSMNGKTFIAALALALIAIVLVGLTTASAGEATRRSGWRAFLLSLQVLVPILFLVVPMQAFLSMRQEVAAGTIEHLLLSRLSPYGVVRGKIAATLVESLIFFSVFAPLIAMTYLLRGVDVPSIVIALGATLVYAIGAATFGIAMGALSRAAGFRALPLIVVAIVLTVGTISLVGGMPVYLPSLIGNFRGEDSTWEAVVSFLLPALLSVPLLFLVAASALAHPYENRSTAFRAFALVAFCAVAGWTMWQEPYSSRELPSTIEVWALVAAPFWIFAATEELRLSPRVRTLVPRSRLLAALSLPFLPGGARGFLWISLFGVLALWAALYGPSLFGGGDPDGHRLVAAAAAWAYVLIYASLARFLRSRLPAGTRGTVLARIATPLVVGVLAVVPELTDLLAYGHGRASGASHLLNPFETVSAMGRGGHTSEFRILLGAAVLAITAQLPAIVRAASEVFAASAERRRRHAA